MEAGLAGILPGKAENRLKFPTGGNISDYKAECITR